jgi:RNA polymerase sigma-70 factor (ECF subfamily)
VKNASNNLQSERSLVASARGGCAEAFTELVYLHRPQVYNVSLRILKNHADAEDNLQDVFCRVHGHIRRFQGRSRFSTWLVRIAINEALMKIRRKTSERLIFPCDLPRPEDNPRPTPEIEDDSPNPERQYIANELAEKVFDGLSPSLAKPFIRHKSEGWTQRELAEEMGTSVSAIKTRIFRARTHLHRRLQPLC